MSFEQLLNQLSNLNQRQKSNDLIDFHDLSELEEALDFPLETGQEDLSIVLDWAKKYQQYSINTTHPNFANRMWSGANLPSILGEVVVALTNTSAGTFESAPVATLLEKFMIKQMLEIIGFKNGEGQMTTGSSNANMIAMMVARNQTLKKCKQVGLFNQQKLVAFVNTDAHYSLDKACNILGIGTDNLIKIPTINTGEMDCNALEKEIIKAQQNNNIPFFVCATLGTTVKGAYDSISDLLILQKRHQFWLHGDGAWGGSVIMSDQLRGKFLTGVEQLNSFTMDFHKMLNTALMCNFLLINTQNDLLTKTCATGDNSYLFRENNDLGIKSLQCGTRIDSLKWFLDWIYFGQKGFAKRVERYYHLIQYAEGIIQKSTVLELIQPRASFNLCFRFKNDNDFNQKLRDTLHQQNKMLLSLAYIDKKLIFRLLISNPNVSETTLKNLLNDLIETGKNYQAHNLSAFRLS